MARRDFGVAIGLPEPFTSELQDWRQHLGDPNAAGHPAARHAAAAHRPARARAGAGGGAPARRSRRASSPSRWSCAARRRSARCRRWSSSRSSRALADCERLEAQVRSGPLQRELKFPYHPHVTVAHDLPEEALDRAFDGLARYEATLHRLGLHAVRAGPARRLAAAARLPVRQRAAGAGGATGLITDRDDHWARADGDPRVRLAPWRPRRPCSRTCAQKRPALDHLIRAFGRYTADAGDRQAAAVTFFGFLSFFPILALATTILSLRPRRRRRRHGRRAGQRLRAAAWPSSCSCATILSADRGDRRRRAAGPGRPALLRARAGSTRCARRSARSGTTTSPRATSW